MKRVVNESHRGVRARVIKKENFTIDPQTCARVADWYLIINIV